MHKLIIIPQITRTLRQQ